MKRKQFHFFALFILFSLVGGKGLSQSLKVNLTAKQIAKIEQVKSAKKKLTKYRKYFSKDSARQLKELSKTYKRKSDSISRHYIAAEKLRVWREKKGIKEPIDTLSFLQQYASLIPKDSTVKTQIRLQAEKSTAGYLSNNQLSAKDLQTKYGLSTADAQLYLAGDSAVRAKAKARAFELAKGELLEGLSAEQRNQLIGLQSKFGFSLKEAKQYFKGDTAARKKMQVQALQSGKQKSLANLPPQQRQQIESFEKEYGPYSKEVKQYVFFLKDSVDRLDTLQSLAASKAKGWAENELSGSFMGKDELKQMNDYRKQLDELKNSPEAYKKKIEQYKKKENLENEVKSFLANDPVKLKALQTKMTSLMKKYSYVQNSNDLSTAVKRTSLKGRPFRERLLINTNFQIIAYQPFSVDLAIMLGYKVNTRFSAGLGANYRQTFKDSIPSISPNVWGYKTFVSYDVYKTFFIYGEADVNTPGIKSVEGKLVRVWNPATFIGIGKRFTLHRNIDMTAVVVYNVLSSGKDSIYPEPFALRVGFQLNGLLIKK